MAQRILKEHYQGHVVARSIGRLLRGGVLASVVLLLAAIAPASLWIRLLLVGTQVGASGNSVALGWGLRIELALGCWALSMAAIQTWNSRWAYRTGDAALHSPDPKRRAGAESLRGLGFYFQLIGVAAGVVAAVTFLHIRDQVFERASGRTLQPHQVVQKTADRATPAEPAAAERPTRSAPDVWSFVLLGTLLAASQFREPLRQKPLPFIAINWAMLATTGMGVLLVVSRWFVAPRLHVAGQWQFGWTLLVIGTAALIYVTIDPILRLAWVTSYNSRIGLAAVHGRMLEVLKLVQQAEQAGLKHIVLGNMQIVAELLQGLFAEARLTADFLEQNSSIDDGSRRIVKARLHSVLARYLVSDPYSEEMAALAQCGPEVPQVKLVLSYLQLLAGDFTEAERAFRDAAREHPLLTQNVLAEVQNGYYPLWLLICPHDLTLVLKRPHVFEPARRYFAARCRLTPARIDFYRRIADVNDGSTTSVIRRWYYSMPEIGRIGPVSERELRQAIRCQRLTRVGSVSRDGETWERAENLQAVTWPGQFASWRWWHELSPTVERPTDIASDSTTTKWEAMRQQLSDLRDPQRALVNAVVTSYLRARKRGKLHPDAIRSSIDFRFQSAESRRTCIEQFEALADSDGELDQLIALVYTIDALAHDAYGDYEQIAALVRSAVALQNGAIYRVALTQDRHVAETVPSA